MGRRQTTHQLTLSVYLDEDTMGVRLLMSLRRHYYDVLTTAEAGNTGRTDGEQLEFARAVRRVIVTSNAGDFSRLHAEWAARGERHAGIVIVTEQSANPEVLGLKIGRLVTLRANGDMENVILYINGDPNQRLE